MLQALARERIRKRKIQLHLDICFTKLELSTTISPSNLDLITNWAEEYSSNEY